jgi:subtilisin family serine protease
VLALAALATAAAVVATAGGRSVAPTGSPDDATPWQGLVGEPRADVVVGQRVLVVLKLPSLADRVARAGGRASDREMRRWTASARSAQRLFVSRLSFQGALIAPEFSYVRVLNAFSAALDPQTVALLGRAREVEGVYPVRAAYPAAVSERVLSEPSYGPGMGRRPEVALPGFDGRGVRIALLDTGVDGAQPYLRGSVEDGIDVVGDGDSALPAPRPDASAELERHGTQLAGILVGAAGPAGLAGVATGASILPIRVAGWQQNATGEWSVYARTDQLLAGLERAVDPNDDGAADDAARIALVGVTEPFAAFAEGPLARAAAGALRLDTLVVAPAGNDGPAGPGFGSISGPGGAPAALTVGAADLRLSYERARVTLRAGLSILLSRVLPLVGSVAPERAVTLEVASPRLPAPQVAPAEQAASLTLADFFDERGFSLVAGKAALVPSGDDPRAVVDAAARAGAEAVALYGAPLPAGALGLDERVPVPVVSVPDAAARAMLRAAASGASTGLSLGEAEAAASATARRVAPFSSRGLAFDGRVKPEVVAGGVDVATSEPGANADGSPRFGTLNGSSAAAAEVAGAAALLAQARPELDAPALKSLLVGSARPLPDTATAAQGAGLVDIGSAVAAELAADPATLAFGRATRSGWSGVRTLVVRNLSARTLELRVRIERRGFPAAETFVVATPRRITIGPGGSRRIAVEARVPTPAAGGPPAEGAVVLQPSAGKAARVPFAVAFGRERGRLLSRIVLSRKDFAASDTAPAVLSLQAGVVGSAPGGTDEVQPLERLDIELLTGARKRIGIIARLRDVLPGRYAFGLTGRDPGGQRLKPGTYRLRLVATPTGDGPVTTKSLQFRIK